MADLKNRAQQSKYRRKIKVKTTARNFSVLSMKIAASHNNNNNDSNSEERDDAQLKKVSQNNKPTSLRQVEINIYATTMCSDITFHCYRSAMFL